MASPIPDAKRAGLPVDLDRLTVEGDEWLTAGDRYALKTHGVCAQLQPGHFMIRIRVPGGVLPTDQARAVARLTRSVGPDWIHLTTRQNLELHWVEDRQVAHVLDSLAQVIGQGHFRAGIKRKPLISAPRFTFSASQGKLFTGNRMQKDRKIATHRGKAAIRHFFRRCPDHHPVTVPCG